MQNRSYVLAVFVLGLAMSLARDGTASDIDRSAPRVTAYAPLTKDGLQKLTPQMRAALTRWLSTHPPLRTIKLFHCDLMRDLTTCEQTLRETPYVAVGSFSGDAHDDFAVLLERTLNAGPDTLVVFNGPFTSASTAAFVLREGIDATSSIRRFSGSGFRVSNATENLLVATSAADGRYDVAPYETGEE